MITEARNSSGQHTDDLKKKKPGSRKKLRASEITVVGSVCYLHN